MQDYISQEKYYNSKGLKINGYLILEETIQ